MTLTRGLFIILLVSFASCFPGSAWKVSPFSVNPASKLIMPTYLAIESGNIVAYTLVLDLPSNTTMGIYRWNASPDSPTLLGSQIVLFASTIENPRIVILKDSFRIDYYQPGTVTYHEMWIRKSDLLPLVFMSTGTQTGGVYLPMNDLLLRRQNSEQVIQSPDSTNTILATYTTPTFFTQTIQYLVTLDESKVFTFYQDQSYFLVRNLTDVSTFASNYPTPIQVTLPLTAGVQHACFMDDYSAIFILDMGGNVLLYHVVYQTLQVLGTSTFFTMQNCYYAPYKNGIIFKMVNPPATTGTYLWLYDLVSMTSTSFQYFPEQEFTIDSTSAYITMNNGADVGVYQVAGSPCSSGRYYDDSSVSCLSCSTGCLKCLNSVNCLSCSSGYFYNVTTNACQALSSTKTPTQFQAIIQGLITNSAIQGVNKVPASRKIIPALCFMVNIDQLWLYMYHQRYYGITMDLFFGHVQKMENQKWKVLEDSVTNVVLEQLGTSKQKIYDYIDTKKQYTHTAFKNSEDRGETFLPACWEFLTFNLLFVSLAFLLLRWGFKLLFQYQISILLRPFSTLIFLAPMLLDGNLQYFCFLMFSQISMGFSLNPRDKMLTAINYIVYFFIIWIAVVSCFLCYYLNKKLTKYIIDNWRTKVFGLLAFSFTNAIRMLIFGALHSLLRSSSLQLPLLMSAQICFLFILIASMSYWRAHKVSYKVWFANIFVFLRIIMQIVLWIQQQNNLMNGSNSISQQIVEQCLALILIFYMLTFYIATIWQVIFEIIQILKPKKNDTQQKQTKPTEQAQQLVDPMQDSIENKNQKQKQSKNKKKNKNKDIKQKESKQKGKNNKIKSDSKEKKEKISEQKGQNSKNKRLKKQRENYKQNRKEQKQLATMNEIENSKTKVKKTYSSPNPVKQVRFNQKPQILNCVHPVRQGYKEKYKWTIREVKE